MGFSGHLVFARSQRPLLEAPLFTDIAPEPDVEAHEWPSRPGGWRTLQLKNGIWEYEMLSGLVEWTGAPACVADVSDSAVAFVAGLDTEGRHWHAWLNMDNAASVLLETPEDVDDESLWFDTPDFELALARKRAELDAEVPVTARHALAWARAAGVHTTAEQHHIEELLRTHSTFAEDLFASLLDELDFPEAPRS
ncbi:hypothetical protein [Streptomyces sp. CB01249]|uniref:hypothetical protein n=1 Tax=Streptomyces sp. CB01249 TaxID=1703929 RepID=UPI000AF7BBCC|nr:hypothetical protein [Streptomyces sp. CB01249]